MLLHTVNKSPYQYKALHNCAEFCAPQDALVLIEDGVYAVGHPDLALILNAGIRVFAIEADAMARGLTTLSTRHNGQCEFIGYDRFVALCVEFPKQKNWS